MSIFKKLSFFSFFFIHLISNSQNNLDKITLFLDENGRQTDVVEYYKKCTSFLFSCKTNKKDSLVINTVNQLYKFDKLSETEMFQLKHLLARDTNEKLLDDEILIINFNDTLFGFNPLKKRMDSITIKHGHDHKISNSSYTRQRKCLKKLKNDHVQDLYFFRFNKDYSFKNKNFDWHKLSKPLNTMFFDNQHSSMLIIKPSGDYFYYHEIPNSYVKKLVSKNWDAYIRDYRIAYTNLLKDRNGFFKEMQNTNKKKPLKFYIEDDPVNISNMNRDVKLPRDVIRVRNRSEISRYFRNSTSKNCFSYGSY